MLKCCVKREKKMLYKNLILLLVFSFVLSTQVFAQDDDWKEPDSSRAWDWKDFKIEIGKFYKKGKPVVSFNYGFSKINLKDINSSFAKPNLLELKLGHESETSVEDNILKYRYTNVFLNYISTDLSNESEAEGLRSNLWRFGVGWSSGYGYDFDGPSLILFNSNSLNWSRLDLKDFPADQVEKNRLDRFNQSFRFGTSADGGIRFKIAPLIALDASYERSIIFERHLFWKWAGSEIIYIASDGLLNAFINEIKDSSPFAAPIVSFALKSALSYGIYELRQEKMNWPFSTAAPLAYDQFKFGITFIF
jgi:hypothetical protein